MTMLNAKSLGLAAGVLWGLSVFVMALVGLTGYLTGIVAALGTVYIGYQEGIVGAIIGLIYGFIDGFIWFFLLGWLYNMFEGKKK